MRVLITQSNYMPWRGYFNNLASCDVAVMYDCRQFTRRDWRNRNLIPLHSGTRWITVPVEVKGKYFQAINETKVANNNWPEHHKNLITEVYRDSCYWDEVFPLFSERLDECRQLEYLSDINKLMINWILGLLNLTVDMRDSREFDVQGKKSHALLDICDQLGASVYCSAPAAKSYLDEDLFNMNGINVEWLDYDGFRDYPYVGDKFNPNLSILDVLFQVGIDNLRDYVLK